MIISKMNVENCEIDFLLKRARYFLVRRDFLALSQFLTKNIPIFVDNAELFYYLGRAHFYMENFKLAEDYLKIGLEKDPDHINLRLLRAVNALKQKKLNLALRLWLEVLDFDPVNKKAIGGLDLVKVLDTPETIVQFLRIKKSFIKKLEPALPLFFNKRLAFLLIFLLMSPIFLSYVPKFLLFVINRVIVTRKVSEITRRVGTGSTELNYQNSLIAGKKEHYYKYSLNEIVKIMNQIRKDFNEYKDNKLRVDLNKIKYSNASTSFKAEAEVLRTALLRPKFSTSSEKSTLDVNYSYQEILSNPLLYEGVFVHWKGKIENVNTTSDMIYCDFLIGYEKGQVLEGRIPIIIPFEVYLDPLIPTEILGQIRFLEKKIIIYSVSVHPIIKPNWS